MATCAVRRVHIPMDGIRASGRPVETPRSVLLVTDDADLRAVGTRVLTGEGYSVVAAAHSGHALLACLAASRPFDILVAEMMTEDLSGPALAETLRRHQPALGAVYLADAGTPARDGVVVRPFTRDDLMFELNAMAAEATSTAS